LKDVNLDSTDIESHMSRNPIY